MHYIEAKTPNNQAALCVAIAVQQEKSQKSASMNSYIAQISFGLNQLDVVLLLITQWKLEYFRDEDTDKMHICRKNNHGMELAEMSELQGKRQRSCFHGPLFPFVHL